MGDVIQFPRVERNWWREFAADLKKQFGRDDAIDWIIADMEPRWAFIDEHAVFQTPADNPEADRVVHEIFNFSCAMMHRTRMQLFFLECELYTARFGGPPIGPLPDDQVTFEVPKPPKW